MDCIHILLVLSSLGYNNSRCLYIVPYQTPPVLLVSSFPLFLMMIVTMAFFLFSLLHTYTHTHDLQSHFLPLSHPSVTYVQLAAC